MYPRPYEFEAKAENQPQKGFQRSYWLFLVAGGLIAAGFVDFALIAFHFQQTRLISSAIIPVYYAVAMGVGAAGAFVFGHLFDRFGYAVLIVVFSFQRYLRP